MTTIQVTFTADPGTTFTADAFGASIGRSFPLRGGPDAEATLRAATVTEDGITAILTLEFDDAKVRPFRDFLTTPSHGFRSDPTHTSIRCPGCGQPATVTSWTREPRETTYEQPNPISRTFEPGPFADVRLSCGCEINGRGGVEILEALAHRG